MEYAKSTFRLSKRQPDGLSLEQHLLQVKKQTGITPPDLIRPKRPQALDFVWSCFLDLNRTRRYDMGTPQSITYSELKNYLELMNFSLTPKEISIILTVDEEFLREGT